MVILVTLVMVHWWNPFMVESSSCFLALNFVFPKFGNHDGILIPSQHNNDDSTCIQRDQGTLHIGSLSVPNVATKYVHLELEFNVLNGR